jgi:hypothetical protein
MIHPYSLNMKLGRTPNRSGYHEEEKYLLLLPVSEPWIFLPATQSLYRLCYQGSYVPSYLFHNEVELVPGFSHSAACTRVPFLSHLSADF